VRAVEAAGGAALFVSTDVSRADAVEALIAETVQRFGRLDCAVNNAGIQGELNPTDECSEENWNRIIGINLTGVWLCMKYKIARMRKQGSGAIVNVASNSALSALPACRPTPPPNMACSASLKPPLWSMPNPVSE